MERKETSLSGEELESETMEGIAEISKPGKPDIELLFVTVSGLRVVSTFGEFSDREEAALSLTLTLPLPLPLPPVVLIKVPDAGKREEGFVKMLAEVRE